MKILRRWMGTGGLAAAVAIALAASAFAAEPGPGGPGDDGWRQYLPSTVVAEKSMSLALIGVGREPLYRGDECPVGSGSYCSDESPYCFMCKGDYTCCWTNEVWRCCE